MHDITVKIYNIINRIYYHLYLLILKHQTSQHNIHIMTQIVVNMMVVPSLNTPYFTQGIEVDHDIFSVLDTQNATNLKDNMNEHHENNIIYPDNEYCSILKVMDILHTIVHLEVPMANILFQNTHYQLIIYYVLFLFIYTMSYSCQFSITQTSFNLFLSNQILLLYHFFILHEIYPNFIIL